MTGWSFSPGAPLFSTNKTDRHDITEILLKVALNTIKPNQLLLFDNYGCLPTKKTVIVYFNGIKHTENSME